MKENDCVTAKVISKTINMNSSHATILLSKLDDINHYNKWLYMQQDKEITATLQYCINHEELS